MGVAFHVCIAFLRFAAGSFRDVVSVFPQQNKSVLPAGARGIGDKVVFFHEFQNDLLGGVAVGLCPSPLTPLPFRQTPPVVCNRLSALDGLKEPGQRRSGRPRRRRVVRQPVVHPAAAFPPLDQPGGAQDRQMLGHGGRRQPDQLDELAHAKLAVLQGTQRPPRPAS